MKTMITTLAAILMLLPVAQSVYAEEVPGWIKTNAGWWADGTISESEFVQGLQYLIKENILVIPPTQVSGEQANGVPDWIKTNAAWWAAGTISDQEFVGGIQHLIKTGILSISAQESKPQMAQQVNSEMTKLQNELDACQEITKAYKRLDCEKEVNAKISLVEHKSNSEIYQVGPVTFYYPGSQFEISASGQPLLSVTMMVENAGSSDNITLMCTGPSICNYDVHDGSKAYKYSGMDFTNGQIVLKPGDYREFTMLFGPNIGYGGTTFEYDSSKEYHFRIMESWGSTNIPLNIG